MRGKAVVHLFVHIYAQKAFGTSTLIKTWLSLSANGDQTPGAFVRFEGRWPASASGRLRTFRSSDGAQGRGSLSQFYGQNMCESASAVLWLQQMVAFAAFAILGRDFASAAFARFRARTFPRAGRFCCTFRVISSLHLRFRS